VFAAIAGHDPRDRGTLPLDKAAFTYSASLELKSRALKIGWLTNAWKKPESGVTKAADAAEKVLKKYFSVKKAALPEGPFEDAGNIIVAVEGASSFRSLIRSGRVSELADPLGQIAGYVNEQFSGADYLQAQRLREILQKKMEALFDSFAGDRNATGRRNAAGFESRDWPFFPRSAWRHRKFVRAPRPIRSLRLHGKESSRGPAIHGARRRRSRRDSRRAHLPTAHRLASQTPQNCVTELRDGIACQSYVITSG
jgi:hypothetical protein